MFPCETSFFVGLLFTRYIYHSLKKPDVAIWQHPVSKW